MEILGESLVSEMDEKERELAKASSVRAEYTADLEELTFWLGRAEAKVQDRGAEPHALKAQLAEVSCEVGGAADQLERLNRNGQLLGGGERASSQQERELVHSSCNSATQQLSRVRHLLEQRRMAVGEAIDAWQKFLDLHAAVVAWAADKSAFLAHSVFFPTLGQTKQRVQEYTVCMKSVRFAAKNVQEMSRELAQISQVAETSDLGEKLHEAEQKKAETEAKLNEKVKD